MPANVETVDGIGSIPDRGVVLVEFHAPWSEACRAIRPALADIAAENPGLLLARIDTENHPDAAAAFGVEKLPTLVLLEDGEPVEIYRGGAPFPDLDRAIGARL